MDSRKDFLEARWLWDPRSHFEEKIRVLRKERLREKDSKWVKDGWRFQANNLAYTVLTSVVPSTIFVTSVTPLTV